MARIVQKFGGTSVADTDRIRAVAEKVKREINAGNEVAVLLSAMAGVTNQLVAYVDEVSTLYDPREYDTVVSTGEQVTVGLMALLLQGMGIPARSWLGWQVPIRTDSVYGKARIEAIEVAETRQADEVWRSARGRGVQGVSAENRVTTLGRGVRTPAPSP